MASTYGNLTLGALCAGILACAPAESGDTTMNAAPIGVTASTPSVTPSGVAASGASSAPSSSAVGAPATPATPATQPSGGTQSSSESGGGAAPGTTGFCGVKAVLDKNCVVCHDGKGSAGAPMGLTKYEDLLAQAPLSAGKKVYQAVGARMHDAQKPMPPAGLLPAETLKLVDAWIAAGAPAPSAACSGAPTASAPAATPWPPPEGCDAIYKITAHGTDGLDKPFAVEPKQETHPQIAVDAPWGMEKVQAIAFRVITDNKKVLHHWILYAGQAFLTGWAPGDEERPPFPSDVGMDMPTGPGSLRLDMHYNSLTADKTEMDRSGVEVCVVKGARLRKNSAAITMSFATIGFPLVPANATNHQATSKCKIVASQPIHVMSASPHSHTYAVGHKFSVKKKDGSEIVMLDKPFVFGEQKSYPLEKEVILENGDTVITTCVYTNKTNVAVNFGEDTGNEMCFNFASYYPKDGFSCDLLGGLLGP